MFSRIAVDLKTDSKLLWGKKGSEVLELNLVQKIKNVLQNEMVIGYYFCIFYFNINSYKNPLPRALYFFIFRVGVVTAGIILQIKCIL